MENNIAESKAVTSMVLGIISLVSCIWAFISNPVIPFVAAFVMSIVGIVKANTSKKMGCCCGKRTAGFVCSLIALIISSIFIVVCFIAVILAVKLSVFI